MNEYERLAQGKLESLNEQNKKDFAYNYTAGYSGGLDEAFREIDKKTENILKMSTVTESLYPIVQNELKEAKKICDDINNWCGQIEKFCLNPFGYKGEMICQKQT